MDNTNKHFKGQLQCEKVICTFRRHWIVLLSHLFGFLFAIAVLGVLLYLDSRGAFPTLSAWYYQASFILLTTLAAYYLHRFFLRMLNYYLQVVIITNYRIVDLNKTVFLIDDRDAFDLHKIQNVQKYRGGVLQTLLNYGELEFTMPAVNITKKIHFVPAPNHYFRCINMEKRNYIITRRHERTLMEREHAQKTLQKDAAVSKYSVAGPETIGQKPETELL